MLLGRDSAIVDRPLRGSHGHLGFSAHHLASLANSLLSFCVEGPVVTDIAGKSASLGGVLERQSVGGKGFDGPHGAHAVTETCP